MPSFVVIDIETTGLSKDWHRITEIAAVRVQDGVVVDRFQTLVNPEQHIPSFITGLTGIDDRMVEDAPTIKEALPDFLEFLGKDVFVAHNATFDFNFLNHNSQKHHDIALENDLLCTRRLASRILPEGSRRLGAVTDYLGIKNDQAHRAMGDAAATAQVLTKLLGMLSEKGITELDDILRFQLRSRRECQERLARAQTITTSDNT